MRDSSLRTHASSLPGLVHKPPGGGNSSPGPGCFLGAFRFVLGRSWVPPGLVLVGETAENTGILRCVKREGKKENCRPKLGDMHQRRSKTRTAGNVTGFPTGKFALLRKSLPDKGLRLVERKKSGTKPRQTVTRRSPRRQRR